MLHLIILLLIPLSLIWDAPTTNTDGTPLDDLAGYKLYSGNTEETLQVDKEIIGATTTDVEVTTDTFFAVTAYDLSGNESVKSNVLQVILIPTPTPTMTVTPTVTTTPTVTKTYTVTRTPTRTRTPTVTRTPTNTKTVTPTRTATPTPKRIDLLLPQIKGIICYNQPELC